jgi:predicted HAD superfamily phosphohydrolase
MRPCRSASANDASDASFRAFYCDAEVVALALDGGHLAVEFADPHDAVPEADVAVVED